MAIPTPLFLQYVFCVFTIVGSECYPASVHWRKAIDSLYQWSVESYFVILHYYIILHYLLLLYNIILCVLTELAYLVYFILFTISFYSCNKQSIHVMSYGTFCYTMICHHILCFDTLYCSILYYIMLSYILLYLSISIYMYCTLT